MDFLFIVRMNKNLWKSIHMKDQALILCINLLGEIFNVKKWKFNQTRPWWASLDAIFIQINISTILD